MCLIHYIAWRMKFFANEVLLTKSFVKDNVTMHSSFLVQVSSISCSSEICAMLNVSPDDIVTTVTELVFRDQQEYKIGNVLVLIVDDGFVFRCERKSKRTRYSIVGD